MTGISDGAVERLRAIVATPDFSGTRYRLVREVGSGGMGVVWEAEDAALERLVAVKVVAGDLLSPEDREHLRAEARILAGLEHPGIVPVHDLGELPDGRVYYAMKLVRGETLDSWAARRPPRAERLRVFLRICEAAGFAHANGVVHRDLKPQNVMVGEFGAVLVMDWGLARRGAVSERHRAIAGTPGYMAPEQARGHSVGAAADVYALGAILQFLLQASEEKKVPRPLLAVCARAMAESPEGRYPSAAALAADVARFLDGEPLAAYRETAAEWAARFLWKNRALAVIVAAYLVMRAILLFWLGR